MLEQVCALFALNCGTMILFLIHLFVTYRTEKEDKADIKALQILNDSYASRITKQREEIERLASENRALKYRFAILKNNGR